MRLGGYRRLLIWGVVNSAAFLFGLSALGQEQVKTVVVMVQETNLGQLQSPSIIENAIIAKLVGGGYRVADPEQVQKLDEQARMKLRLENDLDTIKSIAGHFSADLLVIGKALSESSQDTQGIISARARVSLRLVEAETGRILANREIGDVRGFDLAPDRAGQKALRAAGEEIAQYLLEQLDQHLKRKERTTDVHENAATQEPGLPGRPD